MKKIVALVLSLVMALSLATVAFAAETYDILKRPNTDGVAVTSAEYVKETNGHLAYFQGANGVKYIAVADASDSKWGGQPAFTVLYDGKEVQLLANPYDYKLNSIKVTAVKEHKFVGCGDENSKIGADVYVDADGNYYVLDDNGTIYLNIDGTYEGVKTARAAAVFTKTSPLTDSTGKYYDQNAWDVIPETHVLVLVKENIEYKTAATGNKVVKDVNEYKCAFCGKTYYGSMSNYSTPETAVEYDVAYASHVAAAKFVKLGATDKLADVPNIWTSDVAADTKPADGVNSAKTFDAGVAMYVGMSLLSVAGGAVVIGKKKEF